MHMNHTIALPAVALLLGLGAALPAQAAAKMCADHPMAADSGMKADDAMAKGDAMMADDSMKADDAMAKDGAMMADDSMKADDAMAKDGAMAGGDSGMMMTDYTVKMGNSLWSIAAATLCDGKKYKIIAKANAAMLGRGMTIQPGQVLHIPGD